MFNFFSKNVMKGFKVCKNTERNRKFGIAADTLKVLFEKIAEKFKIENFELFYNNCLLSDENFFKTIPNQSIIIIVEEGDEYKTGE